MPVRQRCPKRGQAVLLLGFEFCRRRQGMVLWETAFFDLEKGKSVQLELCFSAARSNAPGRAWRLGEEWCDPGVSAHHKKMDLELRGSRGNEDKVTHGKHLLSRARYKWRVAHLYIKGGSDSHPLHQKEMLWLEHSKVDLGETSGKADFYTQTDHLERGMGL